MSPDLMLVIGLLLVILSIPALISAFSSDNSLRGATALATVGAGLMLLAELSNPDGYQPSDIPFVILSVIATIIG
ncbi:MAG: hypothetical protein WBA90_09030 [Albidovulum sp.]